MRTPGADFELAAGFLYGEGRDPRPGGDRIDRVLRGFCGRRRPSIQHRQRRSSERYLPRPGRSAAPFPHDERLRRLRQDEPRSLRFTAPAPIPAGPELRPETLTGLPAKLRSAQGLFAATGGLHAAGLFDETGAPLAVREDIGRHNAVDKLVGWPSWPGRLPLSACILMVSGRSSFEILQKAVMAGVPVVCSVSAPSTLAVSTAREFGVTLIGFLRNERFNVYTGTERLDWPGCRERPRSENSPVRDISFTEVAPQAREMFLLARISHRILKESPPARMCF